MTQTLTDDHPPAPRGATAGAAPDATPAAPDTGPAAPGTPHRAPDALRKGGRSRPAPAAPGGGTAPAAEAVEGGQTAGQGRSRLLAGVALVGMLVVAAVGFAASYATLEARARDWGFGGLSGWFPIGVDGAILAFLALDLYLIQRGRPWPVLRFAAHAMTLATVWFNASEANVTGASWTDDPVRAAAHGLMPFLFVVGVEAARRAIIHAAQIEEGTATDRIPLHRWVLSPLRTTRLYRRMRLAGVRSYAEMVQREQDLMGYQVWLTQELGGSLKGATQEQRLPMTMAPRGYTVEQALALPARWRAEAEERQRAQAERERAEAERQRAEAEAAEEEQRRARLRALEAAAEEAEAEHRTTSRAEAAAAEAERLRVEAEAATEAARVQAEQVRVVAERRARAEEQVIESADAAEAAARAAEADRLRAEHERAESAARAESARAEAERQRLAAESARAAAAAAADQEAAAAADRRAADHERAAAAARHETAELEARAQRAEDYARLNARERNERRVARMLAASAQGGPVALDAVPLADIQEALGVSRTTAGELRTAAADLLASGYRPTDLDAVQH
ncbi:DUF2637 domain-containing protein [Streptomyces chumphonensis]|uniref:DUF2637 domain-containing protein n=1 Tax=Streptomyces chumphonensis TaxID=1214925 RepID=UPI003D760C87